MSALAQSTGAGNDQARSAMMKAVRDQLKAAAEKRTQLMNDPAYKEAKARLQEKREQFEDSLQFDPDYQLTKSKESELRGAWGPMMARLMSMDGNGGGFYV